MSMFKARAAWLALLIVQVLGCASSIALQPSAIPERLRTPPDQALAVEAHAVGVQIYECAMIAAQPAHYEWTSTAPEAQLSDRAGRKLGRHYAGPTWESVDGSKVVGEVIARDGGPDSAAIPWLLLSAKSTLGVGVFARVKSIQRLQTVGGKAPLATCGTNNVNQVVRVPYKAVYYFYVSKP